jgi:predicted metal-dependent hydrolase
MVRARDIVVRKITRRPNSETPKYWIDDSAFETHFFNALSTTFPVGERFFIQAVRGYADRVTDPELKSQVEAFTKQEGQHSREHDSHVELLVAQGYPAIDKFNEFAHSATRWFTQKMPRYSLAMTTAVEHLTAIVADELMTNEARYLGRMSPEMGFMWHWHAVEEAEHKAVAFDVYQATGGDYPMRVLAMLQTLPAFMVEIFFRHSYLLWQDGRLFDLNEWRRGFPFLWSRGGLLRSLVRGSGVYFRRDFHPSQMDNKDQIALFEQRYPDAYNEIEEKVNV